MITVLVVEDSLTQMEIFAHCLQQAGLTVIGANSGEDAQTALSKQKPDLVIVDVILPGLSGFELCRELKADPNTSQIPVVICSNKDTNVDRIWGNMLGADAYLSKPVVEKDLLQVVQELILTKKSKFMS